MSRLRRGSTAIAAIAAASVIAGFGAVADGWANAVLHQASALSYSTASNHVVQPQPPANSCRARGSGKFSRPDPHCTPGALNPAVKQGSIDQTICVPGWTSKVRPPERITEQEKFASMVAYGDHKSAGRYEYDHFVPLELGGATNARRNLWPEPGATPNPKDSVENALHRKVCDGKMTLAHAQRLIVRNWVTVYRAIHHGSSTPSQPSAYCRANASYSSQYSDWDVYVHSNQPHTKATVTGPGGKTASWTTNGSGYADVYYYAGRSAAGDKVTVRVGSATCSTTL